MTTAPAATLKIQLLRDGVSVPRYQTQGAAGLDLAAAGDVVIPPGGRAVVPTGIAVAVPPGYEGQVRPRSGLAVRAGVTVLNSPGTIDSDYRGEVGVVMANLGQEPFEVRPGDRIAQLVITPVIRVTPELVDELDQTARGVGGFGHTGLRGSE